MRLNLDLVVLKEEKPGKFNALNKGLQHICTDLMITLDADTLLHKSAVRYLYNSNKVYSIKIKFAL